MSQTEILILVAGLCILIFLALLFLFPLLRKYGIKTDAVLESLRTGTDGAFSLSHAVKSMLPDNKVVVTLDQVLQYAQIGVAKAEQLYKIGEVEGAERKQAAIRFVYDGLDLAGVETTDQIKTIVDGCVEASVHALEPTHKAEQETPPSMAEKV